MLATFSLIFASETTPLILSKAKDGDILIGFLRCGVLIALQGIILKH